MLKMRLQRVGRKNNPSYRIVVTDSRTGPKSNKHVDLLGSYDPKAGTVQLDADRAKDWIAKGVQPSGTVHNMLISQKVIDGRKINVLPRKSPVIDEAAVKAAADAAAAAEAAKAAEEAAAAAPAEEPAAETPAPEATVEETPAAEEEKAA